jgi:hypothetical protein
MRSILYADDGAAADGAGRRVGVIVETGGVLIVPRDEKLRPFLGTATERTLLMVRFVDDQGEDQGWICARLGARHGDDWSGLCATQDALKRGMNYVVQRASPPRVGQREYVELKEETYKVTWVMLRRRPRPRRVVPAQA